jgi:uncharacterized protein (DUF433 family)
MPTLIQIIDRGRGPQLSTSRVTVQDVVPMLQRNCTAEEIMAAIPALTLEEVQVIQQYVRDHYDEVMEQDRCIRERADNRIVPPEILKVREEGHAKRLALMEQFAKKKAQENHGHDSPG